MKRAYLYHTPTRPTHPSASIEELRRVFDYDKETGIICWKIKTHCRGRVINIGDEAGYLSRGYRIVHYQGKNYAAHRLAWFLVTGLWPTELDHKNRNPSNNWWDNLRVVTRGQNTFNTRDKVGREGLKGVYRDRLGKNWFARIYVDNKRVHLGTFTTLEEAVAARKTAEALYYPEE